MPDLGLSVRWFAFTYTIILTQECGPSGEHHPRRPQGACERIDKQPKFFESDGAEERVVTGFSENDRRVTVALGKGNETFGSLAFDNAPVRKCESNRTFWNEPKRRPDVVRKQCAGRSAVDQELQSCMPPVGPGDRALNKHYPHSDTSLPQAFQWGEYNTHTQKPSAPPDGDLASK